MLKKHFWLYLSVLVFISTTSTAQHTIKVKKKQDTTVLDHFEPGSVYSGRIVQFQSSGPIKTKSSPEGEYFNVHLIILSDTACVVFETNKSVKKVQKWLDRDQNTSDVIKNLYSYKASPNRIEIGSYCSDLGWEYLYLGRVEKAGELKFGNIRSDVTSGSNFRCNPSYLEKNYPNILTKHVKK